MLSKAILSICLVFFAAASLVVSQRSICTDDFKIGTCFCKLAEDPTKALNLTSLVNKTRGNPLVGYLDDFDKTPYYISFCVPITNRTYLPTCNTNASVCRQNFIDEDLGRPQYTHFEKRVPRNGDAAMPAMMVDNPFDGRTRSMAFLYCNETMPDVFFKPLAYWGEQDYDGYYLYPMELHGAIFCPVHISQ